MKLKVIPLVFNVISKIDIEGIIDKLKNLDIFDEKQSEMTEAQKTTLGLHVVSQIVPQLGKISNDIIPLIAAYKDMSVEEVEELDIIEVFKEMFSDTKIMGFLSKALQKKVEQ